MALPIEKVLEKVAKLRALAAKAGTMAEAEAAISAASKLMDEYRISEEEIANVNLDQRDEIIVDTDNPFFSYERRTYWKWLLASVIMEHFGCTYYYHNAYKQFNSARATIEHRMIIVGRKTDVDLARYMLGWLLAEVARLCDREAPSTQHNKAYRASWCAGAVNGIREQFKAQRNKDKQNPTMTTAIVKLDSRLAESQEHLKNNVDGLRPGKPVTTNALNNISAFRRGVETGRNIHLGQHLGDSAGGGVKSLKG